MSNDQTSKLTNLVTNKNIKISRDAPVNVGAEQALLGAILSNNLALEKVEDFLESRHFSSKTNSVIFHTLKNLISNNQVADLNTLKIFLENDNDFIGSGGLEYLLKISENSNDVSLGYLYAEVTKYLGLKPFEHEFKVMGMSPYGSDKDAESFEIEIIKGAIETLKNNNYPPLYIELLGGSDGVNADPHKILYDKHSIEVTNILNNMGYLMNTPFVPGTHNDYLFIHKTQLQ